MSNDKYTWLKSARILMIDSYNPPLYPEIELNVNRLVKVMKELSANTLRVPAVGFYAYYQTSLLPVHPQSGKRDIILEIGKVCRKEKFRFIPYFPVGHGNIYKWVKRLHPEWMGVRRDGKLAFAYHRSRGKERLIGLCINSPYRQAIKAVVKEVVSRYDIDSAYFDGPSQAWSAWECFCSYCKTIYRKETGKDVPVIDKEPDWENTLVRSYYLWQRKGLEEFMSELYQTVKSIKDIPVIFNWCDHRQGLGSRGENIANFSDGILLEKGDDFVGKMVNTKLGYSMGKVVLNYAGDFTLWSKFNAGGKEVLLEGFATIASGGTPIIASGPSYYYDFKNRETRLALKDLFKFIKEVSPLLERNEQVKYIGLPYSNPTAEWYMPKRDEEKYDFLESGYQTCFSGISRIFTYSHTQFNPLPTSLLSEKERLKDYPIIFLSNTACMSDREVDNIKTYVKKGGRLLATYETSLYNEDGEKRKDFGLSEVFGVNAKGGDGRVFETYIRIETNFLKGFSLKDLVPAVEYVEVKKDKDAKIIANIIRHDMILSPGIIENTYGKGKVIYVASCIERLYWGAGGMETGVKELLNLFDSLIISLAGNNMPYRIEAPSGVFTNLFTQDKKLILYLINYTGINHEQPHHQIDYICPIKNIVCHIKVSGRIREIWGMKTKKRLPYRQNKGYVTFTLPNLDAGELIVIQ